MSKFTLILGCSVTLGLILAASNNADAGHAGTGSSHHSSMSPSSSFKTMPSSSHLNSMHYYPRSYHGWSSYCWFSRYGCYGYYCPTASCWYYWYPQYGCYLPYTYLSTYAPTPLAVNQNVNQNTNVNVNTGSTPGLPVGATAIASGTTPPLPR